MLDFNKDIKKLKAITDMNGNELQVFKGKYKAKVDKEEYQACGQMIHNLHSRLKDNVNGQEMIEVIVEWEEEVKKRKAKRGRK